MSVKVFVAHHKPGFTYTDEIITPIHVGSKLSQIKLDFLRDDSGDNISELNPFYCEMTAIYWAWKNEKDADYIGLCHYRRYLISQHYNNPLSTNLKFTIHKFLGKLNKHYLRGVRSNQIELSNSSDIHNKLKQTSTLITKLIENSGTKLILPKKFEYANMTNRDHFNVVGKKYIDKLLEIIHDTNPQFYTIVEKTLFDKFIYPANIFIMDKETFNDYCTIMFDVLKRHFDFYQKELHDFPKEYSRISGYMAELISNAYINQLIKTGIKYEEIGHAFLT